MSHKSGAWSKILNDLQLKRDYSQVPIGLKWRSNTFFIVSTITIALFSDLFLYGLIVPVLPFVLHDRIGVPESQIQSHFSALLAVYATASMLFSPFAGYLADRMTTRQAPFLIGLMMLFAATVMLLLAKTLPLLYLARTLQGFSAGFVWTIGLALCIETVGKDNFGKTIGTVFSFMGAGSLVAPLSGGILYEKFGYISVFGVGCAILVVDFVMRVLVIEKKIAAKYPTEEVDDVSSATEPDHNNDSGEEQQNQDDEAGERQPLLAQKQDDDEYRISDNLPSIARAIPILPCLADTRLATAFLIALIQATLLGSLDATIPTVSKEYFGFNSLKSGLLFLPEAVTDLIFGPIWGWAVDRFGTKIVAVLAYTWLIPTLVLLRLPHEGGKDQIILYSCLLALGGVGLAGISAPSIVEAGDVIERYYKVNPDFFGKQGPYAQLYGLNNMVFCLGLTIGPILAGELKMAIGYGNMNLVLAALCAISASLCLVFLGGKLRIGKRQIV